MSFHTRSRARKLRSNAVLVLSAVKSAVNQVTYTFSQNIVTFNTNPAGLAGFTVNGAAALGGSSGVPGTPVVVLSFAPVAVGNPWAIDPLNIPGLTFANPVAIQSGLLT